MQRLIPYHVPTSFSGLIVAIETTLVDEMEKPMSNWSKGEKSFHILCGHIMPVMLMQVRIRKRKESMKTAFSICPCAIKIY